MPQERSRFFQLGEPVAKSTREFHENEAGAQVEAPVPYMVFL